MVLRYKMTAGMATTALAVMASLVVIGGCQNVYPGKDPLAETDADYLTAGEYEGLKSKYRQHRVQMQRPEPSQAATGRIRSRTGLDTQKQVRKNQDNAGKAVHK